MTGKAQGWRLAFAVGMVLGGFLAWQLLTPADAGVAISEATRADLEALGDYGSDRSHPPADP